MAEHGQTELGLDRILAAAKAAGGRGLPPVEKWNPPDCGDIGMRIAADGLWFYLGTPIGRPALVRLFSTVLRRDGDDYFLVTPVEKCRIQVDDAPFLAVEMAVEGEGAARVLHFRTNVDDHVTCDAAHPLRFETTAADGLTPYILVRRNLWAKLTRALTYDLLDLGEEAQIEGVAMLAVRSGGEMFPAAALADIEARG